MCIRDSHKGVHYLAVVEYTENEEDAEDAQLVILSVGEDDETLLEVSKLFEQRLSCLLYTSLHLVAQCGCLAGRIHQKPKGLW